LFSQCKPIGPANDLVAVILDDGSTQCVDLRILYRWSQLLILAHYLVGERTKEVLPFRLLRVAYELEYGDSISKDLGIMDIARAIGIYHLTDKSRGIRESDVLKKILCNNNKTYLSVVKALREQIECVLIRPKTCT
jgi:hypothetical protein